MTILRFLSKLFGQFKEKDLLVFLIGFSIFSVGFWFKGSDCYTCIGVGNGNGNDDRTTIGQCTSRKYQAIISEVKNNPFMAITCLQSCMKLEHNEMNLNPFECLLLQTCCICSDAFHQHSSNYSSNYPTKCRCVINQELCDEIRVMHLVEAIFWSGIVTICKVYAIFAYQNQNQNKKPTPKPIAS